jgi:hypothetical protein
MKRPLVAIAVLALLFVGGRAIVRALAPDETKIRWRLEEMRDGFNETELAPVVDHLHPLFREEQSGADVDQVEQALIAIFFGEIDSATKSFALRVDCDFDAWLVQLGADQAPASAGGECSLFRSKAGVERLLWRAKVELELVDDEHDGWLVQRAAFETLEGDRRLR